MLGCGTSPWVYVLADPTSRMLSRGDPAPDFVLPGTRGEEIADFALSRAIETGPAVLFFYPFDFHPRCTEDLCAMRDFTWIDIDPTTTVFGISPDSVYSHREYVRRHDIDFTLLSDPASAVADRYGIRRTDADDHRNVPQRAVVVADTDATIRYTWLPAGPEDEPDPKTVVATIEDLAT
ncbi:alkyl hydroperoxide reductase [Halobacteriales archaeon SW_7_68_16]|nr:MAG: alkyl hydroperoxide reductase [Halobacteriales archaeon SW_7_68_16]